jgi:hypothetical protein
MNLKKKMYLYANSTVLPKGVKKIMKNFFGRFFPFATDVGGAP